MGTLGGAASVVGRFEKDIVDGNRQENRGVGGSVDGDEEAGIWSDVGGEGLLPLLVISLNHCCQSGDPNCKDASP